MSDSVASESDSPSKDMTAVNAAIHELSGVRLPLQPYTGGHAVFMYSTASDGNVTLQLKEPDDLDRNSLAAMLARLQDDASFSIYTQDTDILSDGSIDVLLGTGTSNSGGNDAVTATFDLFDSSSGPDLTLSPQTFTNSTEAFINDNSNSLGVPTDTDAVSTTTKDDVKPGSTSLEQVKAKRQKPKPTSPNRQGPQQCQVCAKVFGNASALAKHKLTHSDERKYVCTVCGKAFKRQDHLNGHMLTHRNKKPYECKAEGCGKSYCDARSLRRHTENHHSPPPATSSSTTMSPAQGAASGDAASPHGSSCIQYAPPPSTSPKSGQDSGGGGNKSQLQQLLSTEPAKGPSGANNDGLTKQQLDLIHQIMEQTQRQSHGVTKAIVKTVSKQKTTPTKDRTKTALVSSTSATWSTNQQAAAQQCGGSVKPVSVGASSPQSKVTTTTPCTMSPTTTPDKPIPKPVECNLCHRKFKNIPALNGHMRLHGGYFKKDSDSKKNEKKDQTGPPLQTASVSVRALIEEKIINKRITTSSPSSGSSQETVSSAPIDLDKKISSFVVPAPPQHSLEKTRRHSDAETLKSSKTQQEAEALADLILKREKVSVKRTTSDPGQLSQSQLLHFRSDSFSLGTVENLQNDEPQFITPSLQDEVFTDETMILQGVDPSQLAQIQFQPDSLLQDDNDGQLQELNLDDIAGLQDDSVSEQSSSFPGSNAVNQNLQAVLNSPLPESLAEFSTYHSSNALDIQSPSYQSHSPLQSPLVKHDSPGFAYPTPPASHEGQSPCFAQNLNIPLVSPTQDFGQVVERGIDEPPQASSPLSAAFYTSTMSSSAAVEQAIQEVLPGESITEDNIYPLSNTPLSLKAENDSLGLTPVPSPIVTTSEPSPHTSATFSPTPNTSSMSNQWCTGLMLPNSDDPLLSSQPKDFVPKKRFELNGVPVRLISNNGLIELNSTNFAGLLLDSNGEIKLIQTGGGNFQTKNFLVANAQIVTTTQEASGQEKAKVLKTNKTLHYASTKPVPHRIKQVIEVKKEDNNSVFLSPTTIPTTNTLRISRKRQRTEPLQLPVFHQSKLRATRSKPQGSSQYTPQPILNPQRAGTGLYANLKQKFCEDGSNWTNDPIPETDSTPHINIGPQFQCTIPSFTLSRNRTNPEPMHEDLLWDPGINNCSDNEVEMYLDFACCAAVPGGGRNKEYAMHLLHMCGGNIHDAMLRLMQPSPNLPADHPLLAYQYSESDKWSSLETEVFHRALLKFDKDFARISDEIKTKTAKQCIQFYYVWKKVCSDEYGRLKAVRQLKRNHNNSQMESDEKPYPDVRLLGIADSESPMRNFACEYPDCSASFNSRAALNGHIRIHGGTARNSPTPSSIASDKQRNMGGPSSSSTTTSSVSSTICHPDSTDQEYPCKICGKVFNKIKSRSAHMKSHRPPDAEPTKRRNSEKDTKDLSSSSYELSVPSPFSM
ncbi:uncharacterized protein LOC132701551 isoform X3 [Cylas formicarius]|uniref:uncharacterized protein LOC132701551 isoform X3 n=1 Tax=Cylas formicarius TaxID=197179 RepID=UPI002958D21C|nr:uncharacterized protein LOC132701551 isoform X3 [Cylas formicarius]